MRPQTRNALTLVVEKAKRLLTGAYVRQLQKHNGTQMSYSWEQQDPDTKIGPLTVNQTRPDEDATDVLTLDVALLHPGQRDFLIS